MFEFDGGAVLSVFLSGGVEVIEEFLLKDEVGVVVDCESAEFSGFAERSGLAGSEFVAFDLGFLVEQK